MTNVRKLSRLTVIDDIKPALNADRLEIAVIGGWHVVIPKGIYTKGEEVIYVEIDGCIPVTDERFGLSENFVKQAKTINDKKYLVVKTIKLRGNISQGIIFKKEPFEDVLNDVEIGVDISTKLGIIKYEEELPVGVVGNFDTRLAIKSDSERIQNLYNVWGALMEREWIATEKIDGQSLTIANDAGTIRVFTREKEVTVDSHPVFTVFSREEFLEQVPEGCAIQGEFCGTKIQKNKLKLDSKDYRIFTVFDNGHPIPRENWTDWMVGRSVPVLDIDPHDFTPDALIEHVDGMKSTITPDVLAEGVVFHTKDGSIVPELGRGTFKVISNSFIS